MNKPIVPISLKHYLQSFYEVKSNHENQDEPIHEMNDKSKDIIEYICT